MPAVQRRSAVGPKNPQWLGNGGHCAALRTQVSLFAGSPSSSIRQTVTNAESMRER